LVNTCQNCRIRFRRRGSDQRGPRCDQRRGERAQTGHGAEDEHAHAARQAVLRIRISRIRMFLDLLDPDPDPLVRGMDPDSDPSIIKQK
jgi:hypothetical protein